jgi:hypothetical protein
MTCGYENPAFQAFIRTDEMRANTQLRPCPTASLPAKKHTHFPLIRLLN